MKEDGEPDAGDLHVRFDGREVETGKEMEEPQSRGRRTGAERNRKVGDGISLHLLCNTTWISLHRATSRPYSRHPPLARPTPIRMHAACRFAFAPSSDRSPLTLFRVRAVLRSLALG